MGLSALSKHCGDYPGLQVQDLFKFLFQSALGCEHLVTDRDAALAYILREYGRVDPQADPRIDRLAGGYSRVHLSWLNRGLTPETLTGLFLASSKTEPEGRARLEDLIVTVREMIRRGEIPLELDEFEEKLTAWRAMGCPAIHHSEAFREIYAPAYRVIANRYANFLPLFAKIDMMLRDGPVILAIEGGSASGKSTLAEALREIYGCGVIHTDDFFLRPEQRTAERLSEVGGNLDRERFLDEVLPALTHGEAVRYRPFDCGTQTLLPPVTVENNRLTVVEGVYSTHPAFGKYYDLAVFSDISPKYQRARIIKRNPPFLAERFFGEWIPLENRYFDETAIRDRVDLCIPVWEEE
jgi:hypothetical protein